jgi:hypothetical protein
MLLLLLPVRLVVGVLWVIVFVGLVYHQHHWGRAFRCSAHVRVFVFE